MKEIIKNKILAGFFQKIRPTVTNEETFNDVEPIKWNKEKNKPKDTIIAFSAKKKKAKR